MSDKSKIAAGTILVAAAGYVAGILTAPRSGRETRKDIRNAAIKAKTEAERKLKIAHAELSKVLAEATETAKKSGHAANDELKKAIDKADTIRQKTRVILSAIHEGEAEDKDLQTALDEVKTAIKHLKQYAAKPKIKEAE